ncbi:hypothetical protein GZH53_05000 [Flavihumibacter sp. R14]|nr:hypothetical protein [Flavihumibacter soli]
MLLSSKILCSCLLLLSLLNLNSAHGQILPPSSRTDTAIFMLNEKPIQVIRYRYGDPNIRFLSLHDTEKTGLKAAFRYIGIYGGYAVELQYGRVRNIAFSDSLELFSFDPNNMFTDEGAYLGLARHSAPQIRNGLPEMVRCLGSEVLRFGGLDSLGVMITLHNNYNGGFSIYSYTEGNYLQSTADDVFINAGMDPDDLVFVTDRRFFDYLKAKKINVVLQSMMAPDDGSLSVFAMQNNIPYANIEVQHGHLDENYRLIVAVSDMLKEIPVQSHSTSLDQVLLHHK